MSLLPLQPACTCMWRCSRCTQQHIVVGTLPQQVLFVWISIFCAASLALLL
jgi:hypothetical protein